MDSDLSLILKIKEQNDSASILELINRHSGIYIDTINKIVTSDSSFIDKDEIISAKDSSIYSAAIKFDPSKNTKFSTYLAYETKWKCLNLVKKQKNARKEPIDERVTQALDSSDFVLDIEKSEVLQKIKQEAKTMPDKRIEKIIDMRYFSSYSGLTSWKYIAKELNMSIQGCINIHNQFISEFRKKFKYV